ncbi:hypothetical protein C2E23DRAFT_724205 [Lenzites betulinus]|nr:hypothetical protein C2E23DRAFT_724205 [Lenzites betulinus]
MVPTDEQVGDYDPYAGPACTIQDFRPDLGSSPSSPWNVSVVELFVMHFMEKHPTAARDRVEDLFQVHLKYLCAKWQSSFHNPEVLRQRQRLLNRSERQRNLYYRRLAVAHSYADLRQHIPMIMALGVKGMSSDESDHRNGIAQYGVFAKEWRNPIVTRWLRVLDSLYRRLRFGDADENKPGSQPHNRFYSDRVSTRRPPVKGLPCNAYDPEWLRNLHPYDKKHLLVQEDVQYNFSHNPELQKCVFPPALEYSHVNARTLYFRLADDYNGEHNPLGLYF